VGIRTVLPLLLVLAACSDEHDFHVDATLQPRSSLYESVQVFVSGRHDGGRVFRESNVTVTVKARDGSRRVLRVLTREGDPFVAAEIPGTLLYEGVPLDTALLLEFLPESFDERSEDRRKREAEEILAVIRAACRRSELPQTEHLRLVTETRF